ncbi:MAG: LexA repressor [Candidatus Woesebacteria bacterium GW2011_GWB1_40_12]|uniref:LexA repressor n=1 Tax=Candidatus Woesebacteria bacterium GW2011_GWB1_40_12 TaxID=1618576 RepID=A0A0G0QVI7_9BACT|nr:MAG: LexA repressor [Candidatus Woesebacteria bacterium GW2011_GWB1_40_12]
MHDTQQRILQLSLSNSLSDLTLREIGNLVGVPHPQTIKHHLGQLKKRGFLKTDPTTGELTSIKAGDVTLEKLVNIPILGNASCGEPKMFAEEHITGYLKVSVSILNKSLLPKIKNIFAIKAYGDSMNNARIPNGRNSVHNIQEGDYVIVDPTSKNPSTGDYVLSIIEGTANIKKFVDDTANNQVVLISESTNDLPPIHIDRTMDYLINGKVIQVIKAPKY